MLTVLFFLPVKANAIAVTIPKGNAVRVKTSSSSIQWTSKDTSIASVNSKGLVKAKREGKTTVTGIKGKTIYKYEIVVQKKGIPSAEYWKDIKSTAAGKVIKNAQVDFSNESQYFKAYSIDTKVYNRIKGKSFNPKGKVKLSDLRYIKVLHYNWKHEIQVGELIVNKKIATKVCMVFQRLFDEEYAIYSMHLIEKFWKGTGAKSDDYSCKMNNTSAFCYRTITGKSTKLSNHAYGYAIDINPKQNPYVTKKNGKWVASQSNASAYVNRSSKKKGMIHHSDLAYTLLHKEKFKWGGDWNSPKDYQHFEFKK